MIQKLKKAFWKVDGMEYSDSPFTSHGAFHLMYGSKLIGVLSYENKKWKFAYSYDFKADANVKPIMDFPDISKIYISEQLWPFFALRIPSLNQPYQIKKIRKAKIAKDDAVGLLKIFGSHTITNPYRLQAI
jgi:HipA-like protein